MARDKTDKTDKTPVATLATTATRAANEWGIPDWRDASGYAHCESWDLDRWRWEFLRRRSDYRADYEVAAQARAPFELSFSHDAAELYELDDFFAPWVSNWKCGGPIWHPLPLPCIDDDGLVIGSGVYVEVYFDLTKPLGPQLVAAKQELETEQGLRNLSLIESIQLAYGAEYSGKPEIPHESIYEKIKKIPRARKHHSQNWQRYLRVLDAREAGASWAEITKVFFDEGLLDRRASPEGGYCAPPPQAARNLWLQAQALRF